MLVAIVFVFISYSAAAELDTCGISSLNHTKVLSGEVSHVDGLPWMALLQYSKIEKRVQCVGTLISKQYVLTLQLCLQKNLDSVRLGNLELKIAKIVASTDNTEGLALLKLEKEIEFTDSIHPICLPDQTQQVPNGENLIVISHWVHDRNLYSVPVISLEQCKKNYERFNYLIETDDLMCAGGEEEKDSCRGDGGGPLMQVKVDKNGTVRWYATGIVYMGATPCGRRGIPSVYIKVSSHIDWIKREVGI